MVIKKLAVTITAVKRTWCDVTVHGKERDLLTRVRKGSAEHLPVGEKTEVYGYVEWTSSGYGSRSELIICSDEDLARKKDEERQEKILSLLDRFRTKAEKENYYYERMVTEIHLLGCHDYDEEFRKTRRDVERKRWIGFFRRAYDGGKGYIYEKAVRKLHEAGCLDYDGEIGDARRVIREKEAEERRKKEEREKAEGITTLHLPAHNGFYGRPMPGSTLYHNDRLYKVISSYYHDADGWSFGAMNEEWYSVRARDISETEGVGELLRIRAEQEGSRELAEKKAAALKADISLYAEITKKGVRYRPDDRLSLSEVPGTTVYDSFNGYGTGHIYRETDEDVILVINNGMDGDFWGVNNIATGGAGAYAFTIRKELVAGSLAGFKDALAEWKALKEDAGHRD